MELIAAIVLAGPLGFLAPTRRWGLGLYLLAWALILPVQTREVAKAGTEIDWQYAVVNAAILGLGVALNALGVRLRTRRRAGRTA